MTSHNEMESTYAFAYFCYVVCNRTDVCDALEHIYRQHVPTMIMAGKAHENWIDVQHCAFFSLTPDIVGSLPSRSGCFSPQGKFFPSTWQAVAWTPESGCEVWKRKSLLSRLLGRSVRNIVITPPELSRFSNHTIFVCYQHWIKS
jgi:hypothetical protein